MLNLLEGITGTIRSACGFNPRLSIPNITLMKDEPLLFLHNLVVAAIQCSIFLGGFRGLSVVREFLIPFC